jgi:hypothetical protein
VVAATRGLEVRAVGEDAFDEIFPLLALFGNAKMSPEDWREMLFAHRWADGYERGYALYDEGVPVGFLGTIYSRRRVNGRSELFCNPSSWMVREPYRTTSIMLLKPMLARRDCTIVNLTPTGRSYEIFQKLGFRELESEQLILLPPVTSIPRSAGGWFWANEKISLLSLSPEERDIYRRHPAGVVHLLLQCGAESCYIVAAKRTVKRAPFAEILYIGDREFFWNARALVHAAVLRTMGAIGLLVDKRFADGRRLRGALRRPARRLYRPSRPGLAPLAIDGLFCELVRLKI